MSRKRVGGDAGLEQVANLEDSGSGHDRQRDEEGEAGGCFTVKPSSSAAVMVMPERETPGISAGIGPGR